MNKIIAIVLFLSGSLFFYSCQKNTDVFVPNPGQQNGPDTAWYSAITATMPVSNLQNNLLNMPYADSFNVSGNTTTLNTSSGLQCNFPAGCFVDSLGQKISGNINIRTMVIKTRGDMILMNKPSTSNGRLLVVGSNIFISAVKEGHNVQLASNSKIYLRYNDSSVTNSWKLFFGDESNPFQFNWLPNTDVTNNSLSPATNLYEIYTNHLRWAGCGYFYDTTQTNQTTVAVTLPSNYTNANSAVFLVFNDFKAVVRMSADIANKKFISTRVPVGKAVSIVVLSAQANDYYLGKASLTTGTTISQPISITPVKNSLAGIRAYLSTL